MIEQINPARTNRVEIHDMEPFNTWVKGRCVLLGDSAYSTTPDIGQGGCQALENAIYLTHPLVVNTNNLHDALLRYQNARSPRTNELILRARKRCDITHMKDEAEARAWYDELRHQSGENIMKGIMSNVVGNPLD